MVMPNRSPDPHRRTSIDVVAVFAAATAVYMALATWTMLGHNIVMGDAISRLANASYALRGRDPHLEAIGFVWNPLPTLVMIAVLPFRTRWESLGNPGLASAWTSALFMGGTVAATVWTLGRWGLGRGARLLAGAVLATNPLILFYAVNGMSEAFFLFFLVLAVAGLAAWLADGSPLGLVGSATALGACYLVRYEAIAAAGAAAALVAAAGFVTRFRESRGDAVSDAMGNSSVLVLPIAFSFTAFAVASWLITGAPFAQFTSQYGNAAVLASAGGRTTLGSRGLFAVGELTGAAPLLVPIAVIVLITVRGVWGRRATAAAVVFGGVLALSALLQASGSTLPFLRFWIVAVPLQVMLGAIAAHRLLTARPSRSRPKRLGLVGVIGAGVALTIAGSAGATWAAMQDPVYGLQEHHLASVVHPRRERPDERQTLRQFTAERGIARYLDQLDLPPGSVLVDVLDGFPLVLASRNPAQFVIPSDRDFGLVLGDPAGHGVRYLLAVPPTGRGAVDAVNRRFPGIYDSGANIASVELQADQDGSNTGWRLYKLAATTPPA